MCLRATTCARPLDQFEVIPNRRASHFTLHFSLPALVIFERACSTRTSLQCLFSSSAIRSIMSWRRCDSNPKHSIKSSSVCSPSGPFISNTLEHTLASRIISRLKKLMSLLEYYLIFFLRDPSYQLQYFSWKSGQISCALEKAIAIIHVVCGRAGPVHVSILQRKLQRRVLLGMRGWLL
jgi:hypothetical protein